MKRTRVKQPCKPEVLCKRFLIRLDGPGGELDRRSMDTEEEISDAVIEIAETCEFHPGDQLWITDTQPE